jgi:hypothetical protein
MVLAAAIAVLGVDDHVDEIDRTRTLVLWDLHGEGNLPHTLFGVTVATRVVQVTEKNLTKTSHGGEQSGEKGVAHSRRSSQDEGDDLEILNDQSQVSHRGFEPTTESMANDAARKITRLL